MLTFSEYKCLQILFVHSQTDICDICVPDKSNLWIKVLLPEFINQAKAHLFVLLFFDQYIIKAGNLIYNGLFTLFHCAPPNRLNLFLSHRE